MEYKTTLGKVKVEVLGHASLLLTWNDKTIYVDPYSEVHDFSNNLPADLILVTHSHYDHYDTQALVKIEQPSTQYVVSEDVAEVDKRYKVLKNGESCNWNDIKITAIASYNINRRSEEGNIFHPKGLGNGYLLEFGDFCFYIAGDTEPIEEMAALEGVDVAFLPKNLPYTMTDEEFVSLANQIKPKYLYPIHYFELDADKIQNSLDEEIKFIVNE